MKSIFSKNNPYTGFFYRYKLNHVLFWVCYVLFWTVYTEKFRHTHETGKIVAITLVFVLWQAPAAYAVMYYFIPKYLYKRRYLLFLLLFTGIIILAAILIAIGFYLIGASETDALKPGTIFLYTLFGTFETVLPLSVYKILKDRINQESRNEKLEHEKIQAELNFLKAQINPHFLFNAINSIYFLIKKDQDVACATLIKFSDMLRYQLYECNADKISIQKELDYLKNYIELEQLRKGDNLAINFHAANDAANFMISPFMLMPIIENAFKHVATAQGKINTIDISISAEKNLLTMYVANSKENIPGYAVPDKPSGIGLSNLKRRLELLYGGKHDLQIKTSENLYEVTLKIFLDEDQVYNR